ncbi:MAG: hypothetical protein LBH05_00595 [Deferribacteraceae bacterium]|nr:hypothetical protein [Deferribacteraceae bacterium]
MKLLFILVFVFLNAHLSLAQELNFPQEINLFQYSKSVSERPLFMNRNARIWGWSNSGKVAYSIETAVDGRGGQIIDFAVLDLISDKPIFKLKMDSFDHNDATDEALYNLFKANIFDALKTHSIIGQMTEFSKFPIRKNDMTYNGQITNIDYKKDKDGYLGYDTVTKYTVVATADNKRKIIGDFTPVNATTGYIYVCGYFLSPFENRALVVVAEEHFGHEGTELTYRLSGCHLGTGFK